MYMYVHIWGFPKIRGTLLRFPMVRIVMIPVSKLRSPYFRKPPYVYPTHLYTWLAFSACRALESEGLALLPTESASMSCMGVPLTWGAGPLGDPRDI